MVLALNFSLHFLSREKEEKSFFIIFAPIKTNTMPKNRIYLCLAHMSEAGLEQKYIQEAFDTNWVVPLGPNVNGFEKDLEDFVNGMSVETYGRTSLQNEPLQKRVVALSAGTAAVHLSLIACGVQPGDEVIVQSFTFCASSHPITYLGAKPVFVDSEKDSWNMDIDLMEEAIKDRIAKTGKKPKHFALSVCRGQCGDEIPRDDHLGPARRRLLRHGWFLRLDGNPLYRWRSPGRFIAGGGKRELD